MVTSRLRALFDGCKFKHTGDLSASRAADWLAELRRKAKPRVELPAGQELFTCKELAAIVGMKSGCVSMALKRARLTGQGNGKARRYTRIPSRPFKTACPPVLPSRPRTSTSST